MITNIVKDTEKSNTVMLNLILKSLSFLKTYKAGTIISEIIVGVSDTLPSVV